MNINKLNLALSHVQKESGNDEFIYGVTRIVSRSLWQRINDFLIEKSRVSTKHKAYFFELLATMIKAGIPMNRALKILATRTESMRLRRIVMTLSYELEHGRPLSQALDRFSDVFNETERGIIRSAEAIGTLEHTLFKLAANLDHRSQLMMRLASALIYPAAVTIALIIGSGVMVIFVVPRIKMIFEQSALSLPLPTRILLGASGFLTNAWWLILIVLIFAVILFHLYTHSETGRFSWDFRKLRIPLVGQLLRKIFVLRFVDTLGLLIESGLPINRALEYTASAIGNEVYRVKTYDALAAVQAGQKLSSSLMAAPFLFPETITNMLAVGEQSASLGDIAQKIAVHWQREIDHTLKTMTSVLGPMLILVIGAMVAFFALAVLSPIFSLTQTVQ